MWVSGEIKQNWGPKLGKALGFGANQTTCGWETKAGKPNN